MTCDNLWFEPKLEYHYLCEQHVHNLKSTSQASPESNCKVRQLFKGMEDGGVDTTVIESRQHKIGQMADFPPLLASSVFDS